MAFISIYSPLLYFSAVSLISFAFAALFFAPARYLLGTFVFLSRLTRLNFLTSSWSFSSFSFSSSWRNGT
jgi:hypothetical protein